jgi:hypothetical protein
MRFAYFAATAARKSRVTRQASGATPVYTLLNLFSPRVLLTAVSSLFNKTRCQAMLELEPWW